MYVSDYTVPYTTYKYTLYVLYSIDYAQYICRSLPGDSEQCMLLIMEWFLGIGAYDLSMV